MRAFAYVKGSEAHYRLVHLSLLKQAGYEVAFTSISGANGPQHRPAPAPPLQRRAVPAADVRARARRRLRPDRGQGHGRRHARAAAVQRRARHQLEVSDFRARRRTSPSIARTTCGCCARRGARARCRGDEFDWWFDGNPAGSLRSVARPGRSRRRRRRALVSAAWCSTARSGRRASPCTRRRTRRRAGAASSSSSSGSTSGRRPSAASPACSRSRARRRRRSSSGPLGWTEIGRLRVWARPAWRSVASDRTAYTAGIDGRRGCRAGRITSSATREYLSWRYVDSPRGYELVRDARRLRRRLAGQAAQGTDDLGGRRSRWPDRSAAPRRDSGRGRGSCSRCRRPSSGGRSWPRASCPTPQTLHFMGKALAGRLNTDPARLALHARRHGLLLMRRLVFITQQVDPGHPALAATVPKIRALAERVDEVVVLADRVLPGHAAGQLPQPQLRVAHEGRARPALRGRARRRSSRGGRGRSRSSRTCARSTRCWRRRSRDRSACRCCSGSRTGSARGRWRRPRRRRRPWSASTGARSRSTRRRSSPSATASTSTSSRADARASVRTTSASRRSAATRARRGWRRSCAGVALAAERGLDARLEVHGPALTAAEREHRGRARAARRRARPRHARTPRTRPCCARRCPRSSAAPTASSTTWRRARRTRSSTRPGRAACP